MNVRRKLIMCLLSAGAALVLLDGWSWLQMASAREAAARAAADTRACRQTADRILLLQQRPAVASARELGGSELARRVEASARSAGMAGDVVARIAPDAPRRFRDTPYLEQPTQILLRRVTLPQLAVFLHRLVGDGQGLEVRDVRLSVPHEQDADGGWIAEVTLSDLMYSPKGNSERVP